MLKSLQRKAKLLGYQLVSYQTLDAVVP